TLVSAVDINGSVKVILIDDVGFTNTIRRNVNQWGWAGAIKINEYKSSNMTSNDDEDDDEQINGQQNNEQKYSSINSNSTYSQSIFNPLSSSSSSSSSPNLEGEYFTFISNTNFTNCGNNDADSGAIMHQGFDQNTSSCVTVIDNCQFNACLGRRAGAIVVQEGMRLKNANNSVFGFDCSSINSTYGAEITQFIYFYRSQQAINDFEDNFIFNNVQFAETNSKYAVKMAEFDLNLIKPDIKKNRFHRKRIKDRSKTDENFYLFNNPHCFKSYHMICLIFALAIFHHPELIEFRRYRYGSSSKTLIWQGTQDHDVISVDLDVGPYPFGDHCAEQLNYFDKQGLTITNQTFTIRENNFKLQYQRLAYGINIIPSENYFAECGPYNCREDKIPPTQAPHSINTYEYPVFAFGVNDTKYFGEKSEDGQCKTQCVNGDPIEKATYGKHF
ncbi:MAG: hypothetical protein EZS28_031350, partial [Streblomastix strix]